MWYCAQCQKTVVSFSVSRGALTNEQLGAMRSAHEANGELVLFNPPPVGKQHCPRCQGELETSVHRHKL